MNVKSLKKQLVAAIAMVLVAAIALGSSTFAWFAMNNQVTANAVTISAKSNSQFLLIGTGDQEVDAIKTAAKTDIDATTTSATVYPAQFTTTTADIGGTSITENNWYTRNNRNAAKSHDDMTKGVAVTMGDADYMLTNTYKLVLADKSEAYSGKLTIGLTGSGDAAKACVVKVGDAYYKLGGTSGNTSVEVASVSISDTVALGVTVYTYIDGDSDTVYTKADIASITGTLGLTFTIDNAAA